MYVPGLLSMLKKIYLTVLYWWNFFMFGDLEGLGIRPFNPKKDGKDHTAPVCTDSYCFPQRVKLGYITMRPGIERLTETSAIFSNGDEQQFDAVLHAARPGESIYFQRLALKGLVSPPLVLPCPSPLLIRSYLQPDITASSRTQ
jgi:hypothetical protein